MPAYVNFDKLDSYKKLKKLETKKVANLAKILTADRVKKAKVISKLGTKSSPSEETLAFHYAARAADDSVLDELQKLADEAGLVAKYRELAEGALANPGEKRLVLHHLLRGEVGKPVIVEGRNLGAFYAQQVSRIADFSAQVHAGKILAQNGKKFQYVVQVGIGGSDLGPRALYLALKTFVEAREKKGLRGRGSKLQAFFISNVDPDDTADVAKKIDPATTLFILVSKSGTTQETLTNEAMVAGLLSKAGVKQPKKHMICVTSETSPLAKSSEYLASFFIDDFIGGRYSVTSAVGGAVLSLAYGADVFAEVLAGAHAIDVASLSPDIGKNAAMLDALLGVWERNFLGFPNTAVLPYSQAMVRFPAHLQQLDMESNGKQVNRAGKKIKYHTGPVLFGEPGTNGQHSFYQELHQGTDIVPLQFIGFKESQDGLDIDFQGSTSQKKLNANLAAQIVAFALGSPNENPNKNFPGGRPSSLLLADRLTPRVLGAILAHFENKVMFQGFVWNINSFDQEGVQLGKVLTTKILEGKGLDPELKEFSKLLGVL